MCLALVRNQCFYKIHKRKTFFCAEEPNDTFASLSLLLGPVSFLKLLESEGESSSFPRKHSFLSSFLFALYYQGVWGGNPRFSWFSSSAGNPGDAFADSELLARDCLGLKAPSGLTLRDWGVVPRRAESSGSPPGRGGAGGWGRRAESEDSAGAGPVLGVPWGRPAAWPASCVASRLSRPFSPPLPRISWPRLRTRPLYCGPLGWYVSEPGESNSPSQAAWDKMNQAGPPTPPWPRPSWAPSAWACAENASVCWRHGASASLPACVLPETPRAEPFLPPAGPSGWSGGREWGGRAGRASPGRLADGGECWAGCFQRALSRARSRCRCCPCLRGRLAGLWST